MSAAPVNPEVAAGICAKPINKVLPCVLCSQRKVKCDRQTPCSNCVKSRMACVPAAQVKKPRKRRFAERQLLDRLKSYEDLLKQHGIASPEPGSSTQRESGRGDSTALSTRPGTPDSVTSEEGTANTSTAQPDETDVDSGDLLHDHDTRRVVIKNAWAQMTDLNDDLLAFPRGQVDVSTLHPDPVMILRLWQVYLDNVNPLLKVTHTPSLQARLITTINDLGKMEPTFHALMFSIYCLSVTSLDEAECLVQFNASKADLLARYQPACQHALADCGYLRTSDCECLVALYLYLVSIRSYVMPQSLSSILGIATRIAQRIGINREPILAKCSPLEAEFRRRLWWSLFIFDTRIGELADTRTAAICPAWDCKLPLNCNDCDFNPGMKSAPPTQTGVTDALYVVVRATLAKQVPADFASVGHDGLSQGKTGSDRSQLDQLNSLEKMLNEEYLCYCNGENPLHFKTLWTTRGLIARYRLVQAYSDSRKKTFSFANSNFHAITMLQCDTKVASSPLTKGFSWMTYFHFPLLAYIQLTHALRRQPFGKHTNHAWETMSTNFEAHADRLPGPALMILAKSVLPAWDARKSGRDYVEQMEIPHIVTSIRRTVGEMDAEKADATSASVSLYTKSYGAPAPVSTTGNGYGVEQRIQSGFVGPAMMPYVDWTGSEVDLNGFDWAGMDWDMPDAPFYDFSEVVV